MTRIIARKAAQVFIRIGSYNEETEWRRSLARTTYLHALAPRRDYIFVAQSASVRERREHGDLVCITSSLLLRCNSMNETKPCRSGLTFAFGLRWAHTNTNRSYILSVDDDGFLCTPQLPRLLAQLPAAGQGVVLGSWHKRLTRPDQQFVLLSRDVAEVVAARYLTTRTSTSAARHLASFLTGQAHPLDARRVVLHPDHSALAQWYQAPTKEAAAAFCARHLWIHFCCTRAGDAAQSKPTWRAMQAGAEMAARSDTKVEAFPPLERVGSFGWGTPLPCADMRITGCTKCKKAFSDCSMNGTVQARHLASNRSCGGELTPAASWNPWWLACGGAPET